MVVGRVDSDLEVFQWLCKSAIRPRSSNCPTAEAIPWRSKTGWERRLSSSPSTRWRLPVAEQTSSRASAISRMRSKRPVPRSWASVSTLHSPQPPSQTRSGSSFRCLVTGRTIQLARRTVRTMKNVSALLVEPSSSTRVVLFAPSSASRMRSCTPQKRFGTCSTLARARLSLSATAETHS